MSEAPLTSTHTIFEDYGTGSISVGKKDIEYIRKDIAESRIKELEEALRFYADDGNFAFYQYYAKELDEAGNEFDFGTTARKALEKEGGG